MTWDFSRALILYWMMRGVEWRWVAISTMDKRELLAMVLRSSRSVLSRGRSWRSLAV